MSGLDALRSMPRDPRSSAPQRTNGRVARETCVVEIHFPRRFTTNERYLEYFIFYILYFLGKRENDREDRNLFFFYLLIRSCLLINRDKVKECNSVDFSLVLAARSRTMKEWVDRKMAILDRRRVSHTG